MFEVLLYNVFSDPQHPKKGQHDPQDKPIKMNQQFW